MRRILSVLLIVGMGCQLLWAKPAYGAVTYDKVRVCLSSMGTPSSVTLIVNGSYSIAENPGIVLENRQYQIRVEQGMLQLSDGTTAYPLGGKFTFKHAAMDSSNYLRVMNNSYGWVNYLGNMEVRLVNGGIQLINHIDLETYLYGVVPYEMSNSWPLEALKAQTVAARTYAARSVNPSSHFDLYDTEYSQVYKGYNPAHGNCIMAVNETAGTVLKYGIDFAATYYSASNGGMTESTENLWVSAIPYLTVREDPYDIRNVNNTSAYWTVEFSKLVVEPAFQIRLKVRLRDTLERKGYSGDEADIVIRQIADLYFAPPNSSGRMSDGLITLVLDVKRKSDGQLMTVMEQVTLTKGNTRSILNIKSLLFTVEDAGDRYILRGSGYGHGIGMSQYGAQQMALEGLNYAQILEFYYPGTYLNNLGTISPLDPDPSRGDNDDTGNNDDPEEPVNPQEPIDPENPVDPEDPADPEEPVNPENPEDPKDPVDPGDTGDDDDTGNNDDTGDDGTGGDNGDTSEPQNAYGIVDVSTSLNVRQGPGLQYVRIAGLSKNTRVEILERNEAWFKIKAGNTVGYVHMDYIKVEQEDDQGHAQEPGDDQDNLPPVDPALPPGNDKKYGIVIATALNVRSGPSTRNHKVGMVINGSRLTIVGEVSGWYKIDYNGIEAFVSGDYVTMQDTDGTPSNNGGSGSVDIFGRGIVTAYCLNVRSGASTQHPRVALLAQNQTVELLEFNNGWYKIRTGDITGYVHGGYINETDLGTGVVTASSLNIRAGAGLEHSRISSLSRNTKVRILASSKGWYKIEYGSLVGYASGEYIQLTG